MFVSDCSLRHPCSLRKRWIARWAWSRGYISSPCSAYCHRRACTCASWNCRLLCKYTRREISWKSVKFKKAQREFFKMQLSFAKMMFYSFSHYSTGLYLWFKFWKLTNIAYWRLLLDLQTENKSIENLFPGKKSNHLNSFKILCLKSELQIWILESNLTIFCHWVILFLLWYFCVVQIWT